MFAKLNILILSLFSVIITSVVAEADSLPVNLDGEYSSECRRYSIQGPLGMVSRFFSRTASIEDGEITVRETQYRPNCRDALVEVQFKAHIEFTEPVFGIQSDTGVGDFDIEVFSRSLVVLDEILLNEWNSYSMCGRSWVSGERVKIEGLPENTFSNPCSPSVLQGIDVVYLEYNVGTLDEEGRGSWFDIPFINHELHRGKTPDDRKMIVTWLTRMSRVD